MGIQIVISMDWEGTSLEETNLEHIKLFKQSWNVPIVHYFNPAYYTNKSLKGVKINKKVKAVLDHYDEVGLHMHAPRHFVQAAEVIPRSAPCFSKSGDFNPGEQNGQEVMLLAYSKEEIKQLLDYSVKTLRKNGFKNLSSFRAGGWMSDERVWEALIETGFPIESSATNPDYLNGSSWEGDNLQRYINLIWGKAGKRTKPYYLQTFSGSIYEVPNNMSAIDYWDDESIKREIFLITRDYKEGEDQLLVINSHQETFKDHYFKLDKFLKELHQKFGAENIEFATNKYLYEKEVLSCG